MPISALRESERSEKNKTKNSITRITTNRTSSCLGEVLSGGLHWSSSTHISHLNVVVVLDRWRPGTQMAARGMTEARLLQLTWGSPAALQLLLIKDSSLAGMWITLIKAEPQAHFVWIREGDYPLQQTEFMWNDVFTNQNAIQYTSLNKEIWTQW